MAWLHARGIEQLLNDAGCPTQNACIEDFNGQFRNACLNAQWFESLRQARRKPPAGAAPRQDIKERATADSENKPSVRLQGGIASQGGGPLQLDGEQFKAFAQRESMRLRRVISEARIQLQ